MVKKVRIPSIEFRRPSIIRASGHTFEYLGFGPGNYSTGLPQVQDKTPTEDEEYLSQAQERSAGVVVYTGMNNKGDFYVGNQKKSAATGEEITFNTPIPTVTGQDPSKLSVVFDEVIIKERLVVEGGRSNQLLSQFDGPVTFNNDTRFNDQVRITDETDSTSTTTGALIVTGGVGVGKTLTAANVTAGDVTINGSTSTITSTSGDLKIDAPVGNKVAIGTDTEIDGNLTATGTITADRLIVPNISPIGSIMMWPGALDTWPTATWRQCNGAGLSTSTHSDLFNIIGYTYGGSGSTFNLPNLQNRFVAGAGDTYSVNDTGGQSSVTLTVAEMPSHNHTISDNGHTHGPTGRTNFLVGNNDYGNDPRIGSADKTYSFTHVSTTASNTTGIQINPNGSGTAHENRPPYIALYYIIRIK